MHVLLHPLKAVTNSKGRLAGRFPSTEYQMAQNVDGIVKGVALHLPDTYSRRQKARMLWAACRVLAER